MMLGYLSPLTYSVFIHLLALSLHYPSLAHSLSRESLFHSIFHFFFFFTLRLTFVTITRDCHTAYYKIQVLAIEGDGVQQCQSPIKNTALTVQQIVVVFCRVRTVGASTRVQSGPGYSLWQRYCYISIATGYCLPCICLAVNVPFSLKAPQETLSQNESYGSNSFLQVKYMTTSAVSGNV